MYLTLTFTLLVSCSDSSTGPGPDPDETEDPADSTESVTGTLAAIVATSGSVSDADGYIVTLDDTESKSLALNDTIYFERLEEGDHDVAISSIAEGCTADHTTQSVTVTGDTTSVTFSVSCREVQALVNKIVFTAQSASHTAELFVMDVDGSNLTEIDNSSSGGIRQEAFPDVSPDGTQIAFMSYRDGQDEVYIMNTDGSSQERLTDGGGTQDSYAVWSPDGSKIAFRRHTQTFEELSYAIYMVNPDGSGLTELFKQDVSIRHLDWSPVQ